MIETLAYVYASVTMVAAIAAVADLIIRKKR